MHMNKSCQIACGRSKLLKMQNLFNLINIQGFLLKVRELMDLIISIKNTANSVKLSPWGIIILYQIKPTC